MFGGIGLQLSDDLVVGEASARAVGLTHIPMPPNVLRGDMVFRHQALAERQERPDLLFGGACRMPVGIIYRGKGADKADPDPVVIVRAVRPLTPFGSSSLTVPLGRMI